MKRAYSANDLANAVLKVWGIKQALRWGSKLLKDIPGKSNNHSDNQFTWEEINEILYCNGISIKIITKILFIIGK